VEHSSGPWSVRKSGTGRTAIVAADNLEVAFIFRNQRFGAGNAGLVAAAPDLLDALERVLPAIQDPKMVEVAANAIARARSQGVSRESR
jgi:hypothetical protein